MSSRVVRSTTSVEVIDYAGVCQAKFWRQTGKVLVTTYEGGAATVVLDRDVRADLLAMLREDFE